ncbi:MAG: FG-GAP repeat domain-containing protein [Terriglobia bacterium]
MQTSAGIGWALASKSASGAAQPASPRETRNLIEWQTHEVAKIPGGYQVAVADVNGDGRVDILGLSSEKSIIEWYENPTWKPHPVTSATRSNISLAPLFHPGYPARGVALASDFSLDDSAHGGSLWWAEPDRGWDHEWRLRPLGKIPTSHRLRWGNLDGTGRLSLVDAPLLGFGAVAPDYKVPALLTWFGMPEIYRRGHASAADAPPPEWPSHRIDESMTVVHGLNVLDWDGDGRDEILTASFEGVHLFHSAGHGAELTWTRTHLGVGDQQSSPKRGSSEIGVGKVAGKRFLATIEPWHGDQVVVYSEASAPELWTRHVIDPNFHEGHGLVCADLDGDGNEEIVAGFRGPGTSLCVYYAADNSGLNWQRQLLDTEMATSGLAIADINGDGRQDIVAIGSSTGNVKWYENRSG